jgi:hypothetical protein
MLEWREIRGEKVIVFRGILDGDTTGDRMPMGEVGLVTLDMA